MGCLRTFDEGLGFRVWGLGFRVQGLGGCGWGWRGHRSSGCSGCSVLVLRARR